MNRMFKVLHRNPNAIPVATYVVLIPWFSTDILPNGSAALMCALILISNLNSKYNTDHFVRLLLFYLSINLFANLFAIDLERSLYTSLSLAAGILCVPLQYNRDVYTNAIKLFCTSVFYFSFLCILTIPSNINQIIGMYFGNLRTLALPFGGDPNGLSIIIGVALILVVYVFRDMPLRRIKLLILLAHFMLLFSRASLVAISAIFIGSLLLKKERKKMILPLFIGMLSIGIVIYLLSTYFVFPMEKLQFTDSSSLKRYWALSSVLSNLPYTIFLLGEGSGTALTIINMEVHNSYITRLIESGIVGLLTFLMISFAATIHLRQIYGSHLFLAYLYALICLVFVDAFHNPFFVFIWWLASNRSKKDA